LFSRVVLISVGLSVHSSWICNSGAAEALANLAGMMKKKYPILLHFLQEFYTFVGVQFKFWWGRMRPPLSSSVPPPLHMGITG